MKRFILLLLAATMLFALASCGLLKEAATSPPPTTAPPLEPEGFVFTKENMPAIDGSTATIPLIGAVYSVMLGIDRDEADAMVEISGTDNAYMNLIEKKCDLLLVYSPAPDSLEYADGQGVELEMAPIGKDALVFLVNRQNELKSLSEADLVKIYSGGVTNWSEVGGDDMEIKAYQRQHLSGSQTMMDSLVMKGKAMADPEPGYVISEMGGLVEAVAQYDNSSSAIGYNVYYYVSRMKMDDNVRLLAIDGVEPTKESISEGKYPFVSDFYAVIRKDSAADSPERILFDWIQTKDGQTLVDHEGYATNGAIK